jgi:hypothetical protein
LYEFLRFEVAQTSMVIIAASADNMAASVTILRGQSNLKTQKFVQLKKNVADFQSRFRAIFA